jgi:poly-gamma-glutamate synthesis protein (capsule biosynthesis protein)
VTSLRDRKGTLLFGLLASLLFAVGAFSLKSTPVRSLLGFAAGAGPTHVSLLFVGDIMLDRYIRELSVGKGYDHFFEGVAPSLRSVDMVVANLEGPITSRASLSYGTRSVSEPGHMQFTFASTTGNLLKKFNIGAVTLGNNHILDFGREGYKETVRTLDQADVAWFGGPYAVFTNARVVRINGVSIALVAFNQFLGGDVAYTEKRIREMESQVDLTIVYAHWGEEYETKPSSYIVPWSKRFVDAGADLVIGAHPHVVIPFEEYKNVRMYYSLGNFIFDQYWMKEVRCGLGVRVDIEKYPDQKPSLLFTEIEFGRDRAGNTFLGCT